jgi:hypothetical protein
VQRKLGTTRGSPRRSRTAKASRISRHAVKSRCAREWGGWGRLSDDGPGQNNPDPSEGPWGRWSIPPHGGAVIASTDPTLCGSTLKHEGRRQTDRRAAHAGSRLKLIDASGRSRLTRQPFSRNGENSPYGMLGGIVETSASFEARSAPRSYPTAAERSGCLELEFENLNERECVSFCPHIHAVRQELSVAAPAALKTDVMLPGRGRRT